MRKNSTPSLEEVPIPIASEDSQREVEFLVEQLTDASEQEYQATLKKIDKKVAEIYGLGKRALKLISL